MSLKRFFINILLNFYIISARASNECFQNGVTWSSVGQIAFLPQIESVSTCIELCAVAENCNGYTWHGKFSTRLTNICVLFDTLSNEHKCVDCISGNVER